MVTASDDHDRRSPFSRFVVPIVRADEQPHEPATVTLSPLPFMSSPKFDKVGGRRIYEPGKEPWGSINGETGFDRLKDMFKTDIYGSPGPEWTLIIHGTYGGVVAGVILGAMLGGNRAKENYLARNQATKYHTELHAKRALQDRITLGVFSYASRFGLKMGAFSFLFIFNTTLLSVYRGRTSVVDFIAAGSLTGVLWRITMGPRAVLVSGILGSVLGLFAGCVSSVAFYLSGTSMEELRYWHYHSISKSIKGDDRSDDNDKLTKSDSNLPSATTGTSTSTTGTAQNVKS